MCVAPATMMRSGGTRGCTNSSPSGVSINPTKPEDRCSRYVGRQLGLRVVETALAVGDARRHHHGAARAAGFENVVDDADVGARQRLD